MRCGTIRSPLLAIVALIHAIWNGETATSRWPMPVCASAAVSGISPSREPTTSSPMSSSSPVMPSASACRRTGTCADAHRDLGEGGVAREGERLGEGDVRAAGVGARRAAEVGQRRAAGVRQRDLRLARHLGIGGVAVLQRGRGDDELERGARRVDGADRPVHQRARVRRRPGRCRPPAAPRRSGWPAGSGRTTASTPSPGRRRSTGSSATTAPV